MTFMILVVGGVASLRKTVAEAIEAEGYAVRVALDSADGAACIGARRPRLIVLVWDLYGDGRELLGGAGAGIPAIVVASSRAAPAIAVAAWLEMPSLTTLLGAVARQVSG
jgi:DNA-binding response OmpR family regulator